MRLVDADELNELMTAEWFLDSLAANEDPKEIKKKIENVIDGVPLAYDAGKVVEEVKKLDLDGVSMVEDGKYKLVRKNEVISLIQTNGVCNGRDTTCADCYKMNCPLSTKNIYR